MKTSIIKICKIFFICIILIQDNIANALSPLPKNAYLRFGDNQREVKILQQILNSDPDTIVDSGGAGSPGQENWYFGKMTENALKKFQTKNNLEPTGRIDFKTWRALNNYVTTGGDQPPIENLTQTNTDKIKLADTERIRINLQNKKDFEEARKLQIEKSLSKQSELEEKNKSYIQSIIDKFSGGIFSKKETSPETQLTTQTNKTNSTIQEPSALSQIMTNNGLTPLGNQYSNNPYSRINAPGYYASQAPFSSPSGLPFSTSRLAGGSGTGQGFGQVVTTVYGHMRNGAIDSLDNGLTACGQNSRLGGNGSKAISLKKSLRISIFGNVSKSQWCGKEIEITNPRTGKCGVYPLLEEGPQEHLEAAMDMTGTVWNELDPERRDGSKNIFRFRVLSNNDEGCSEK